MSRGPFNLLIDMLAAASLLTMVATGYVLRFPLPPATNRTHVLWGLSRHEWGTIHSWASLVLLLILVIHVVLHWDWIVTMIRHRFTCFQGGGADGGKHAGLLTLAVLFTLAGLFALATHLGVRQRAVPLHPLNEPPDHAAFSTASPRKGKVDFWKEVMPVFQASCITCHGPTRQTSGFRADQREDFFSSRNGAPLVVPGDSAGSRLLNILSGKQPAMKAAAAHRLPPDEILLLKTWIDSGADWPAR
jgi:mono/diheme cytochrome c family protein